MRVHSSLSHWVLAAYFEILQCLHEANNREYSQFKLTLSIQVIKYEELQYGEKIFFFRSFYFKFVKPVYSPNYPGK